MDLNNGQIGPDRSVIGRWNRENCLVERFPVKGIVLQFLVLGGSSTMTACAGFVCCRDPPALRAERRSSSL
jgi:hypothetical protein